MNDPPYAVSIWLEGDHIMVRFPDRQLVPYPIALGPLIVMLKARAARHAPTVGTQAAPVAYDVDEIARALQSNELKLPSFTNGSAEAWERAIAEAGKSRRQRETERTERARARLLRKDAKDRDRKAALALAKELNL